MFQIDIQDPNPGVWFDMKDGARVCVRALDNDARAEIDKHTTRKRIEMKKGRRVEWDEVTNQPLRDKLMWDYCIMGWENIVDAQGNPVPVTDDMKSALMRNPYFSGFVLSKILELSDVDDRGEKDKEKN